MGVTEQFMDHGGWDLELDPSTRTEVLDNIDIRTRWGATYVRTPEHWRLGDLSDADLLGTADYCGRYKGMGQDRRSLDGDHISSWLGTNGDGGNLFTGVDASTSGLDLEGHLDARVFASSNGLAKGSVNANATTFVHKREGGDTRWEMLHTLCAMAPGGPYYFRVNSSAFTIDADKLDVLWPTALSANGPSVVLSQEGGRDAVIAGLYAILDLDRVDGSEVRTGARIDWNDATDNGTATASLPATFGNLVGGSPVDLAYLDWRPKRGRPPTEMWRKVAAWNIAAQARADVLAAREVTERTLVRPELTATLSGLEDPWRYDITPGNTVYVYDLGRKLIDTANEIYYRGEAIHPDVGRVDEMTVPSYEGNGHYLRCWDGVSAFEWIDLTERVVPEGGPVELRINQRDRFDIRARRHHMSKRDSRQAFIDAHWAAQLQRFVQTID
jgi:hypothetical protein